MPGEKKPSSSTSKRRALRHRPHPRRRRANEPSTTRTKAITPRYWSYVESKISARGGACGSPVGRRDAVDHRLQHLAPRPSPVLAEIRITSSASLADQVGDLGGHAVRVGGRQVDLVDHRDDLEVVLDRQVGVGERLRLDALRGVDHQQRPLARGQAARDLVGEVDVARACRSGSARRLRSSAARYSTRTACALMVMPRSRSSSIESSTCSRISRSDTVRVSCRMRSASVDLPWSMCAMIEKLRMRESATGEAVSARVQAVACRNGGDRAQHLLDGQEHARVAGVGHGQRLPAPGNVAVGQRGHSPRGPRARGQDTAPGTDRRGAATAPATRPRLELQAEHLGVGLEQRARATPERQHLVTWICAPARPCPSRGRPARAPAAGRAGRCARATRAGTRSGWWRRAGPTAGAVGSNPRSGRLDALRVQHGQHVLHVCADPVRASPAGGRSGRGRGGRSGSAGGRPGHPRSRRAATSAVARGAAVQHQRRALADRS